MNVVGYQYHHEEASVDTSHSAETVKQNNINISKSNINNKNKTRMSNEPNYNAAGRRFATFQEFVETLSLDFITAIRNAFREPFRRGDATQRFLIDSLQDRVEEAANMTEDEIIEQFNSLFQLRHHGRNERQQEQARSLPVAVNVNQEESNSNNADAYSDLTGSGDQPARIQDDSVPQPEGVAQMPQASPISATDASNRNSADSKSIISFDAVLQFFEDFFSIFSVQDSIPNIEPNLIFHNNSSAAVSVHSTPSREQTSDIVNTTTTTARAGATSAISADVAAASINVGAGGDDSISTPSEERKPASKKTKRNSK